MEERSVLGKGFFCPGPSWMGELPALCKSHSISRRKFPSDQMIIRKGCPEFPLNNKGAYKGANVLPRPGLNERAASVVKYNRCSKITSLVISGSRIFRPVQEATIPSHGMRFLTNSCCSTVSCLSATLGLGFPYLRQVSIPVVCRLARLATLQSGLRLISRRGWCPKVLNLHTLAVWGRRSVLHL